MQCLINEEIELQKSWDGKGEPWCIFSRGGKIVKDEAGRELRGVGKIVIRWWGDSVDATDLIEEDDETDSKAALVKLKQVILDRAEKDEEGFYTNPKVQKLSQEPGAHLERAADFDEIKYNKFVKGNIVTHFHPDHGFGSFSLGDFKFALLRKPLELRVFGPDGRFVFREVYKNTTWDESVSYEKDNPMSRDRHSWWLNASKQLGFEYERVK